jgi:glycosyltransferase involved in cell wall biosynthesis
MKPKVSVITITFNAGHFLQKTIESIINQSNKNFEYLIIDGGSKDNTLDIIQQYENEYFASMEEAQKREDTISNKILWISEPDKGLYDAMNKGLHLAHGDFVWFINAGDKIYDDTTMQTVVDTIDNNSFCDVVYGQSIIIDEEDNIRGERHKIAPKNLTKKSLLNGLVVCHQSILVRKNIAPDYDIKYRISADYDWVCKVLTKSRQNCYIDKYISRFMIAGVSAQQRKKSWLERYDSMKKHFGFPATCWAHLKIITKYLFSKNQSAN